MNAATLASAVPPRSEATAGGQEPLSRYGVLVGGQRLLLATDGAVRVLDSPALFRLPNTHPWCLGLANVRGTLVPVHDVAAWLRMAVPDSGRMLLVVGDGDAAAGVLIDASPRHLLVAPDTAAPRAHALPDALGAFAGDAFGAAGETWCAVDWQALFAHLKTQALVKG